MPPRLRLASLRLGSTRQSPAFSSSPRCWYSATSTTSEPLVRVTNVPAPNTGHIRVLELNRPAARNAISKALLFNLREEIDAVHAQYDADTCEELATKSWNKRFGGVAGECEIGPTRAVVLASAVNSCFCAGADLKERKGFTQEEYVVHLPTRLFHCPYLLTLFAYRTEAFLTTLRATFTTLAALPVPTISAISSLALGGGLELALSTHFRVLTSNAVVGLPETRLGIIPGAGGTHRLPSLIGIGRARDLILTGRRVSAPEAYFLGIADRLVEIVPETEEDAKKFQEGDKEVTGKIARMAGKAALSEAVRLAMEICEGGPVAVRAALQAVQRPHESVENAMYERVVKTEDRNEALRAFGEKRKPVFKGR